MSFIQRISKEQGSIGAILKPYPEIATPVSMMTEYVMRSEDVQFTRAEREIMATFVSDLNACTYAARTHQAAAEALGVDDALFNALLDDIDAS
ncbi:MAG: AhpD family alkylhydroperoxidase, partial [Gammaproteobacteria bacterium]